MKLTIKFNFIICVSSVVMLTGCQSGFLKKPDLGRLAFWKNDNLRLASKSDDVLPPSAHFSPDMGDGSATKNEMKANIDQIIANAKRSNTDAKVAETDPIRKPYSIESVDSKTAETKTAANDFVMNEKLNKIQSATNRAFDVSNRAFDATENLIKNAGTTVEKTANTFSGWKNTVQDSTENQIKQVANEFKNQADSAVAKTNDAVNQFVNNSEKTINQTVSNVQDSISNSFQSANVVSNPYASESKSKASTLAPIDSTASSNEFVSKYKQAARQFGAQSIESKPDTTSTQQNNVQHSSFVADLKKETNQTLQPVSTASATQYPSTSFGKFQPLSPAERKTEEETFKVPPQLLRGQGSFSPGSTKPLRPVTSEK